MSNTDWSPLATIYDPVKCGNIDGTGTDVHDGGILRALKATYKPNKGVSGNCDCTLFIGKLNPKTTEETLKAHFLKFGKIVKLRVVKDLVTGYSKRYAFIEFSAIEEARLAYNRAHGSSVDGATILVEYEFERTMPGWVPRRLGGGFGGNKESGQLRFGCRMRPFKKPYTQLSRSTQHIDKKYHSSDHRSKYSNRAGVSRSGRDDSDYDKYKQRKQHHRDSRLKDGRR